MQLGQQRVQNNQQVNQYQGQRGYSLVEGQKGMQVNANQNMKTYYQEQTPVGNDRQQQQNSYFYDFKQPDKGQTFNNQYLINDTGLVGFAQNQQQQLQQMGRTVPAYSKQGVHYSPVPGNQGYACPPQVMTVPRSNSISETKAGLTSPGNFATVENGTPHSFQYVQAPPQYYNQPTPDQSANSMSFYRRFKKINQQQTECDGERTQKRNNYGQQQMVPQPKKQMQNIIVQDQRVQYQPHMAPMSQYSMSGRENDPNQLNLKYFNSTQPNYQMHEQIQQTNYIDDQKDCVSSDSSMSYGNSNNQTGITMQVDGILSNNQQIPNNSKLSVGSDLLPEGIFRSQQPNIIYEYNPKIQAYQKKLVSVAHNFSNEYCNPNQSNYSSYSPSGQNSFYSQQPLFLKEKSNSLLIGTSEDNYQMHFKNQMVHQNQFQQQMYYNEDVSTPLAGNRGSLSVQVNSGQINDDHSAKSCSANKQVRFVNAQGSHHEDINDYHAQSQIAETKDMFEQKQKRTLSGSAKKKSSKSPHGKEKKVLKQPSPLNSRNNRVVQTNASKRSKSNKSQLSQKSSLSTLSNIQKSNRKSKRSKHSRSVSQQQVDEYNKLSHVKNKKGIRISREEETSAMSKRNVSSKKRKAQSKSPKINVVSKNKKFQTIFIEADGLSNNQIRQIDRVSKILKNERPNKSPVRRRSISNKKKELSAKRKSNVNKVGTLQTYDDQYNSINSRETKSKNSNKTPNLALNGSVSGHVEIEKPLYVPQAQHQPQQWVLQRDQRPQGQPQQQVQQPNQTIESVQFIQNQSHEHPQLLAYQKAQMPRNEMLVRPIEANLVSPKQFMTMHEYASPKYTLDSSVNNEILLTNQINQYLLKQKQQTRPESGQGLPIQEGQYQEQDGYQASWQPQTVLLHPQHQMNSQHDPACVGTDSLHTIHANTSNGNTIQQQLWNTQNTLQPCWNPTHATTHTHQTISPQNNIGGSQHQAKVSADLVEQTEPRLCDGEQEEHHMQTFHNIYGDQTVQMDNSMIDQLSQMKDQRHKGQKSYNNDDINDVVPEANKERIDTNRSCVTNTNTATTHLTNALGPQTVHNRSKQTVGTDVNLFSQKRVSAHGQVGELSSNMSANDKSLATGINMVSCVTSSRWKENQEKQPIDSTREAIRPNAQDREESDRLFVQRQLNHQPSCQNSAEDDVQHAPRLHQEQTHHMQQEGEGWVEQPTYPREVRNTLGRIASPQDMADYQQQEHISNVGLRYNPSAVHCSNFPSNGDLGSLIDRDLTNMGPRPPSSRNEKQMEELQRNRLIQRQNQEANKARSGHNAKFISFNDSQQIARNQTIEQQNMMLLQRQMHSQMPGGHSQSLPSSYPESQGIPASCRNGYQQYEAIQYPRNQIGDCYYSQPQSFSQTQQTAMNYHPLNYQPNQVHLASQKPYLVPASMVETPWGQTQSLTPITHPSATISPMTSTYNLEHCSALQQQQPILIHEVESMNFNNQQRVGGQDIQVSQRRPQILKREQGKTNVKGHRSRKSQPEAVIAVKLVKKGVKRADRSPSKVSMKSTKSKKSSKSQVCKRQILEISMNTLSSKQPKVKKMKSSRSLSNISKKSKNQSINKTKHKLSQTQTIQDFVDQKVGQQPMVPSLIAHAGQTGYVWPYNMTSPSVGSPYPVIFVKDVSQPATQREPARVSKEQQGFIPMDVGCRFESLDGIAVNQHTENKQTSHPSQVSPQVPSGLTFAGFQGGQRPSNPALANLTQIQNNQSMDQQDLELEQCALEAFNIANDVQPQTLSKQKSQTYYSENLGLNQTPEQDHQEVEQHVNWYLREQADEQEGFIAEADHQDAIVKSNINDQFNQEVSNQPINSNPQYAQYQQFEATENLSGPHVNGVRLIYDPVQNKMYNQFVDGSLVQVDQKIHVLQEGNQYGQESRVNEHREPTQPAASLNSLQSAQFCAVSNTAQATCFSEPRKETLNVTPTQEQISHSEKERLVHEYNLLSEQKLKEQLVFQESQELPENIEQMIQSQALPQQYNHAQNQYNKQSFNTLKPHSGYEAQPIVASERYISIQDEQTRNHFVDSLNHISKSQTQKRRRSSKSATPRRFKTKVSQKSKKRNASYDTSSVKFTERLLPQQRIETEARHKSPMFIKRNSLNQKKVTHRASKSASKPRNYKMSIDRIVQRPFNRLSQKSRAFQLANSHNLPAFQRKQNRKNAMTSRSVGLLPRKRLITPAQRSRNATPNHQILSNLRKNKSPVGENNSLFSFRRQQNLIQRLHSDGRRSASPMAFSHHQASTIKTVQNPGISSRQPTKRSATAQNFCGNTKCRSQLSNYKDIEQAKYLRELQLSKKANDQQIKSLNQQCKRRLEFYKHSMHLEKAKTRSYVDTIKEMHSKIDNVRIKNQALYSKIKKTGKQKSGQKQREKSEKQGSMSQAGRREGQTSEGNARYIYHGGDCLKSNDKMMMSLASQNQSTLSNNQNPGQFLNSSSRANSKSKSARSKGSRVSKDRSRKASHDKHLKDKQQTSTVDRSINMTIANGRGQKVNMINQLSTFDGIIDGQSKVDLDDDLKMPRLINVQNSKMLEPHSTTSAQGIMRHNNQSSIEEIARGTQRQNPQNSLQLATRKVAASHRVTNFPQSTLSGRNPPVESSRTIMTQTSTTSSVMPSEKFYSLSTKMKCNNKEIKRIENILYKNDKFVAKNKGNLLASNRESMQAFASKANAIENKWNQFPSSETLQENGFKSKRSTATASNPKILRSLIDEISMRKVYKIDKIDKN